MVCGIGSGEKSCCRATWRRILRWEELNPLTLNRPMVKEEEERKLGGNGKR